MSTQQLADDIPVTRIGIGSNIHIIAKIILENGPSEAKELASILDISKLGENRLTRNPDKLEEVKSVLNTYNSEEGKVATAEQIVDRLLAENYRNTAEKIGTQFGFQVKKLEKNQHVTQNLEASEPTPNLSNETDRMKTDLSDREPGDGHSKKATRNWLWWLCGVGMAFVLALPISIWLLYRPTAMPNHVNVSQWKDLQNINSGTDTLFIDIQSAVTDNYEEMLSWSRPKTKNGKLRVYFIGIRNTSSAYLNNIFQLLKDMVGWLSLDANIFVRDGHCLELSGSPDENRVTFPFAANLTINNFNNCFTNNWLKVLHYPSLENLRFPEEEIEESYQRVFSYMSANSNKIVSLKDSL